MSHSFKHRFWACYLSLTVTGAIIVWAGLIPEWGEYYSEQPSLRRQTKAIEDGHIALATDVVTLDWDQVWDNGKVQQVWGLAVPIWRLPFEWLARLFGRYGFPDRLVFAFSMAGVR